MGKLSSHRSNLSGVSTKHLAHRGGQFAVGEPEAPAPEEPKSESDKS